jgi:hypothetical protein
MHDCQRFREDWVAGSTEDFGDCDECRSFCEDAQLILQATDGSAQPMPEFSEYQWRRFEGRLRENLVHENASRRIQVYWKWSGAVAAVAALAVVVTWGATRVNTWLEVTPVEAAHIEMNDDHIKGLDPMVVEYLEQSELFLRNFTKIEASYAEDIDDSRDRAKQSLQEIGEQRELAGNFVPVQIALDEYENVLREIKNLDTPEHLADIQTRIRANGLIANLKAYQPQVRLVSQR